MDIFAAGCVLAELFMDGDRLFDYPDLNMYRRQEFPLEVALRSIAGLPVYPLIVSMLSLPPEHRPSIHDCCAQWEKTVFPACFSRVIFPLLSPIVSTSVGKTDSDEIISIVVENSQHLWRYLLRENCWINYETEERLVSEAGLDLGLSDPRSILIITDLVCSHIRFLKKPRSKAIAIEMLSSFSPYIEDEEKLHRVLPYLISIMTEKEEKPYVIVKALKTLVEILQQIRKLSMYEVGIFDDYIWPFIYPLRQSESLFVKYSFCKLIPEIAKQGKKFLNLSLGLLHSTQQSDNLTFDKKFGELCANVFGLLRDQFLHCGKDLHQVIYAGLRQLPNIAGWEFTSTFLLKLHNEWNKAHGDIQKSLSHLLSDISSPSTPEPLIKLSLRVAENGLFSNDEFFMYYSLRILETIDIRPTELVSMLRRCKAVLIHPNLWVREQYITILENCIDRFSIAENYQMLVPIVSEFVGTNTRVSQVTKGMLRSGLVRPLPRTALGNAVRDEGLIGYKKESLVTFRDFLHVSESFGGRLSIEPMRKPQQFDDKTPIYSMEKGTVERMTETFPISSQSLVPKTSVGEDFLSGKFSERMSSAKKTSRGQSQEYPRAASMQVDQSPLKYSLVNVLSEHSSPVLSINLYESTPNLFHTLSSNGEIKLWNFTSVLNLETISTHSMKTHKIDCNRVRAATVLGSSNLALVAVDGYKANPFDSKQRNGLKVCGLVEYAIEEFISLGEDTGPALSLQTLTGEKVFAYTTQSGSISVRDLRTNSSPLSCDFGSQMGLFTTSAVAEEGQSLILGSTSGYVLVYDLRFNSVSSVFLYSKKGCITSVCPWKADKRVCFAGGIGSESEPLVALACGSGEIDISFLSLITGKSLCYITANTMCPTVPYLIVDESGGMVRSLKGGENVGLVNEMYCSHYFTSLSSYIKRSQGLAQFLSQTGLTQSLGQSAINLKRMFESRTTVSRLVLPPQGPLTGYLLSSGFDSKVRMWDLLSPKWSREIDGTGSVYYNQQLGDCHVIVEQSMGQVATGVGSALRSSDVGEAGAGGRDRHSGDILDMKFGKGEGSGLILTAGRDGTVRVWG